MNLLIPNRGALGDAIRLQCVWPLQTFNALNKCLVLVEGRRRVNCVFAKTIESMQPELHTPISVNLALVVATAGQSTTTVRRYAYRFGY